MSSVGKSVPHESAVGHATGAAAYLDDIPLRVDELIVGFVGSPVSAGTVDAVDTSKAEEVPGVVAAYTAEDFPGEKKFGPLVKDEPFLADGQLLYHGQPVVAIAAESGDALLAARAAVRLDVKPSEPVLSLDDAINRGRFLSPERRIFQGDAAGAIERAAHRLSGVFECGGQEQFYLESQAAIAYPGEASQIVVHSSTQNPSEIQAVVAEALGLGMHQVVCNCRRMGGAFGGKETQAVIPAVLAALVASKTGRPARVIYTKDDDMRSTGKRHQYQIRWEVGFDGDGRIEGLRVELFSNGGATVDLSPSVLERSMLHLDNTYYLPAVEIRGRVCFTNYPPNTAFRGFGGPQAMAAMEQIIHDIAIQLHSDSYDVRMRNLYGVDHRNKTPYNQIFVRNHLPEIFSTLAATSQYKQRLREIETANASSKLTARGIALTGVKFGISFTTKHLNQANALVNAFTDGTIQVSTGATEMGQGVHTKVRQLVADEFGIAVERVMLMPTSTEKNNNTSPSAASASTDLNGAAAIDACQKIKSGLQAFAASHFASAERGLIPSPSHIRFANGAVYDERQPALRESFAELCRQAHRDRVSLGARGFYATPGVDFNRDTGRGNPFLYFTQGAAVSEVEVDRLTGELGVVRVDLLIDIGESINPGVDRGQIVGGFVQGQGWVTTEQLVYDDTGQLLSYSPTTYKIPAVTDVPLDFRCDFFANDDNIEVVRRSKAVGEPPLMLAISIWSAVRHALSCVAPSAATRLRLPATGEEILRCLTRETAGETPRPRPTAT